MQSIDWKIEENPFSVIESKTTTMWYNALHCMIHLDT